MPKAGVIRMGLGIVLGAAAGIGLIFYFYKQKRKKPSQKNSSRYPIVHCQQNAMYDHEHAETLQPYNQGKLMINLFGIFIYSRLYLLRVIRYFSS